jgi:hypothetical protein
VQTDTKHGILALSVGGTLEHQWNIIDATKFSAKPHAANISLIQYFFIITQPSILRRSYLGIAAMHEDKRQGRNEHTYKNEQHSQ